MASLADQFARDLGAADLGRHLGLWHDIGKFDPPWQRYLLNAEAGSAEERGRIDHKRAGAELAAHHVPLLALLVQGHHGGLRTPGELAAWLEEGRGDPAIAAAVSAAREHMPDLDPATQLAVPESVRRNQHAAELFLRLLFSALVDADFLDTERHMHPERPALRGAALGMSELWSRFLEHQTRLQDAPDTAVNRARREMYQACLEAAEQLPGLFRLAMPTGGGKTLSGMAFALQHALRHGHGRIVVAVPFITITEQTADVYRGVFEREGDVSPVVLEHHSGATRSTEPMDGSFEPETQWRRLAAETWDSPVVVTTTVQLFESLFAANPSAVRKLHRLARSVIILDEAQALPAHLLTPILSVLRHLCEHYGTTVVVSTATQPAFETIPAFRDIQARDIVANPARYFAALKRVSYEWRVDPPLAWKEVAELVRSGPQALAVVNTKKDALALLDVLDDPGALHLSTLLCGAHRRNVIAEVKRRLAAGEPCRLISTQVIEAGVDLDFPLALRALGPLDSIIQSAGRCNREGRLERGRVIVFRPQEGGQPRGGTYRLGTGTTEGLLGRGNLDPDNPQCATEYFKRLITRLGPQGTDGKQIQPTRGALNYPEVAKLFQMIEDDTDDVVISTYGDEPMRAHVRETLERLRGGATQARHLIRRLQPFRVAVYRQQHAKHVRRGLATEVFPGLWEWHGAYDPVRGIEASFGSADELVV